MATTNQINSNFHRIVTTSDVDGKATELTVNLPGANVTGQVAFAAVANSVAGGNVTGQVAFAATANSIALANVAGAGNIASLNLDGNVANILHGDGTWNSILPIANGTSNIDIPVASGNVVISANGAQIVEIYRDFTTTTSWSNFIGNGYFSENFEVGGNILSGPIEAAGDIKADNLNLVFTANVNDLKVNGNVLGNLLPDMTGATDPITPGVFNVSAFDLGSPTQRWKDLWLSNTTIYLGDSALSVTAGNLQLDGNTLIHQSNAGVTNLGSAANLTITGGSNGQVLTTDGTGNLSWTTATPQNGLLPPYKGFRAHYGRMYGNGDDENGPIDKVVIYQSNATPSSTIDTDTSSDSFSVIGLSGSGAVAMLVVIHDGSHWNDATPTTQLKTFVESVIDNVILDGGTEGSIRGVSDIKTAFYDNYANFSSTMSYIKSDFEFYETNTNFNVNASSGGTGTGFNIYSLQYNMSNDTIGLGSWSNGSNYVIGDIITILGTDILDANNNPLSSPANDVTVTITGVNEFGNILAYTVTGTLPRPTEVWPTNSINDGGNDEYDTANYINTDIEGGIIYNSGVPVISSTAFGGGDYVVTYQAGIFGIFTVNAAINEIGTSGNSGFDGDGVADTGPLFGQVELVTVDRLTNGDKQMTLSSAGVVTLPGNSQIYEREFAGGFASKAVVIAPQGYINQNQRLEVYPTFGVDYNHLHLTSGDLSDTELFLGNDNQYVKLVNNGAVEIRTTSGATWGFGTDGNLTLPDNTFSINYANGTQVPIGGGGDYGDSNVATLLGSFGSNSISTTGNVTANNFVGNISITENIVGTGSNVSLVAGSFTATFDNTGILTLPTMGADEGGEINLGVPATNTTLLDRVVVDVYRDKFRIFDGSTKGVYIDLSQAKTGVDTLLNNRVSGFVDAGTFVTMDNIRATVTTTGNRGLSLATVTGSFIYNIGGTFAGFGVSSGGTSASSLTLTTTPTSSIFGWGFTNAGDIATYIITNTSSLQTYRITLQIGGSFNNNSIIIERLI